MVPWWWRTMPKSSHVSFPEENNDYAILIPFHWNKWACYLESKTAKPKNKFRILCQWNPNSIGARSWFCWCFEKKEEVLTTIMQGHTSQYVKNHLDHFCFTLLQHPAYSPDLSLCDFDLFGTVKESFKGKSFDFEEELLQAIDLFSLKNQKSSGKAFFKIGLEDWELASRKKVTTFDELQ